MQRTKIEEYREFIRSKHPAAALPAGALSGEVSPHAKGHQKTAIDFALEKGKSALFLDTGLGKSFCQLEFARIASETTGKPSLILTPLAVAAQMVREGEKFDIEARKVKEQSEVKAGINIANYERLKHLDPCEFGAICLDESSILKSFQGKTRKMLQEAFADTPYRLALTATPAPNDHMELGQHAEFLGICKAHEMLTKFFVDDKSEKNSKRLKGHAFDLFWEWVASWARAAVLPSDIGGDDSGYILPDVKINTHEVDSDLSIGADDGMLFRIPEQSATSIHKEKAITLHERVARASELADHSDPNIIWCERNDESTAIAAAIPDAVEIRGDMTPDEKERRILGFQDGEFRVLVTKPKLAGFGVNWQHCHRVTFASITHSYEQFYQALRRCHRFGQSERVSCDIIFSTTERSIWNNLKRKQKEHESMKTNMRKAMTGAQSKMEASRASSFDIKMPEFLKGEKR